MVLVLRTVQVLGGSPHCAGLRWAALGWAGLRWTTFFLLTTLPTEPVPMWMKNWGFDLDNHTTRGVMTENN